MLAIFTDFGVQGPYLGQMRAVLLAQAPAVPVVDIFPDLPAFHVQAAAYLLPAYSQYLPNNCVCVCVVDPGVGTNRRALVVRADSHWYVGPDNGLFSILIRRAVDVQTFQVGRADQNIVDDRRVGARREYDRSVPDALRPYLGGRQQL